MNINDILFKAKVIQVIATGLDLKGEGVSGDPVRRITQFWSLDGELLAEVDPLGVTISTYEHERLLKLESTIKEEAK